MNDEKRYSVVDIAIVIVLMFIIGVIGFAMGENSMEAKINAVAIKHGVARWEIDTDTGKPALMWLIPTDPSRSWKLARRDLDGC